MTSPELPEGTHGANTGNENKTPPRTRGRFKPSTKTPPGTRPSDTPGGDLERRIARVEFAEGAFVRLRVPVPAEVNDSGRDILTDIDVLSVDVTNRLHIETSSYECKGGAGQKGEPYTIVWLAGFRQLLHLNSVSIVRQTVSARGRNLARELQVTAVDAQALARREAAHSWLPDNFGHVDGAECIAAESRTDVQLKGLPDIPLALTRFLRGHGMLAESAALVTAVAALGSACERQGVLPEPTASILGGHALVAVLLAAIRDAGRIDALGEEELRARLERAVTVGDEDDVHLLPLLERADSFIRYIQSRTHRAYANAGAEPIRLDVPSLRDAIATPPDYLDDYLDLVVRLRSKPMVSSELLQTAELVCFEALLGGTAWKAPAFEHLFTPEHKGLLLVALRCVRRIGGNLVADPIQALVDLPFRSGMSAMPDRQGEYHGDTNTSNAPSPQFELGEGTMSTAEPTGPVNQPIQSKQTEH